MTEAEALRIVNCCRELCWQFDGGPLAIGAAYHLGLITRQERLDVYRVLKFTDIPTFLRS